MNPKSITRADLLHLLEENDVNTLIQCLKDRAAQENNEEIENQVILLSSRYTQYLQHSEQELAEAKELRIELNRIKAGLLGTINQLNLEAGILPQKLQNRKLIQRVFHKMMKSPLRWFLVTLLISLGIIGIGQIRLPKANLIFIGKVKQLGLRTTKPWLLGDGTNMWLDRFEAYHLLTVSSFSNFKVDDSEGPFSLLFTEGQMRLDSISIASLQEVTLLVDQKELQIKLNNGTVDGGLLVKNSQMFSSELGINQKIGVDTIGDFLTFSSDVNPEFSLVAARGGSLILPSVEVDSIGFFKLEEGENVSTIQNGFIQVGGAKKIELFVGDPVLFSKLENGRVKFRKVNQQLEIELSGQVTAVRINQNGLSRSLMPTWYGHLSNNHALTIYVGIFLALILILNLLRMLLKK